MVPKHVPELAHEVMKSSAATNGEGVTRDDGDRDNKAADEVEGDIDMELDERSDGDREGEDDAVDSPTPLLAVGNCVPSMEPNAEPEGG